MTPDTQPAYPYLEEVNEGIVREFRRLLPVTGRVLDVGCGRGSLGRALTELGWEVWGVEQAGTACAVARDRLHRLVEADLTSFQVVRDALTETTFDALLLSDVLEHVVDPSGVLEQYLAFVKPGGRVFVSVPNFLVWTNRVRLMFGRADYADTGVMDRTHLRLFTFRTARRMMESAGLKVCRVASTPYLVRTFLPVIKWLFGGGGKGPARPDALLDSKAYRLYQKYGYPPEQWLASLWRTLFAFRIIVVGQKPAEEGM